MFDEMKAQVKIIPMPVTRLAVNLPDNRYRYVVTIQHWALRVYTRARPCGISAIWKKRPHKIHVAASNGAQKKNRPKDKH